MKAKEKFEVIFICLLILIGGGLLYIHFADLNEDDYIPKNIKDIFKKQDYNIIDKIEECNDSREDFYSDEEYIYYFNCRKSNLIYLEYEDGTIKPMKEELNNGNVSLESLLNHGLKCEKEYVLNDNATLDDNETDVLEDSEDAQENKTDED